jgi:hypothetical protein
MRLVCFEQGWIAALPAFASWLWQAARNDGVRALCDLLCVIAQYINYLSKVNSERKKSCVGQAAQWHNALTPLPISPTLE